MVGNLFPAHFCTIELDIVLYSFINVQPILLHGARQSSSNEMFD